MAETMRYVQFVGGSRVEVREGPVPTPGSGEALVRIAVSAICGSELSALRRGVREGQHNPGHEMAGVVVEAHGLKHVQDGQRVGLQVTYGCGRCICCLQGDPKHCVNEMDYLLNAHSEYVVAPEMCLVPLPEESVPAQQSAAASCSVPYLDWETAVLLCGDAMGTPYRALKRLGGVHAGETAAVFGCGPIGLGCLIWLKFYGVRAIVSEISPYRRDLARSLGADLVFDPAQEDVVARIHEETGGGADLCLDCSPAERTLVDALNAARVYGRVGWIGEKPSAMVDPSGQVIHKELRLAGSWYFTVADFHEELALYRCGLSPSRLITHRYALDEAPEAYRVFASGETGKVLFCHKGFA
jgi:threonine dehydrogenase-like Zn-dependent dehydrogenase